MEQALVEERPMNLHDWAKGDDGKVEVWPLVAFETLVAHGRLCGLKLRYLEQPQQLTSGESSSLQLVMTPEMAQTLADALVTAASQAETGQRQSGAH